MRRRGLSESISSRCVARLRFPAGLLLAPLLLLSGCAYVHFGRIPPTNDALEQQNFDLRMDKDILKQELVIARKEGDALRSTLDASANGADVATLTKRLAEAARDIGAMRVKVERASSGGNIRVAQGGAEIALLRRQLDVAQEGAASAQRDAEALRAENRDLRRQLDAQKDQNLALAAQVQGLSTDSARLRAAIADLNSELLAQKQARNQAEQAAAAARDQLHTVLAAAQANAAPVQPATSFGNLREGMVSGAAAMDGSSKAVVTVAPDGSASVMLRAHAPDRSTPASGSRTYVVQSGDTLESIAKKFYGTTERWNWIYAANNALLRDNRPLRPGMQLVIPDSPEAP